MSNDQLKRNLEITEEIFYNKELSDAIREIVKKSIASFSDANIALSISENYEADVPVIIELFNNGFSVEHVVNTMDSIGIGSKQSEAIEKCIKLFKIKDL